jgi:hypothetical protein
MHLRWRALAAVIAPFPFAPAAQGQVDPLPTAPQNPVGASNNPFTQGQGNAPSTTPQNPVIGSNNPLSSKLTITHQNYYWPSVTGQGGADAIFDRFSLPFDVGGIQNVMHIYVPSQGSAVSNFGLGDVVAFDFIVQSIGTLQYGVGPLVVLPTASHMGSKTWEAGLAGAIEKRWDWGLTGVIVTYARSVAGPGPTVSFIGVMPTLTYSLGEGLYLRSTGIWHLGLEGESSYIPVGLGIGKVWTCRAARR